MQKENKSKKILSSVLLGGFLVSGCLVMQGERAEAYTNESNPPLEMPTNNFQYPLLANSLPQLLLMDKSDEIVATSLAINQNSIENTTEVQTFLENVDMSSNPTLAAHLKAGVEKYEAEVQEEKRQEQERIALEKKRAEEAAAKAKATAEKAQAKAKAQAQAKAQSMNDGYLPTDHYNYLVKKVKQYGLDLHKTMAVMKNESNFNASAISSTDDYGYFQINIVNHARLSNLLGTANEPLNPYVNIDWGTYMLADLKDYFASTGLTGQALDEAVLSAYNKGLNGYKKYGKASEYISKWKTAYNSL